MAGIDLATAYVNIVPSAKGIKGSISNVLSSEANSAGNSAGENVGNSLVSKLKTIIAAAGIGALLKKTLEAGADLQQSFGGLETLYGDAADAAKNYANEAAKAGISANNYAEQAVSFGASLKAAFDGDTTKAVEAANTAILDMADNSAKMGTDITSIQNAYQGFAKGNYTMLDNLKIGYSGSKTEMERLLADAEKLSGVHYDISNLGDVYSAIHVIQEDLGLTGVAAEEASETFSGSFASMKASAENLMANLSLGEDIGPSLKQLFESVKAFLVNNLIPMVMNIIKSLPDLIKDIIPMILSIDWLGLGIDIINGIIDGIASLIMSIPEMFLNIWNQLTDGAQNAWDGICAIFGKLADFFKSIFSNAWQRVKDVFSAGGKIFDGIKDGIVNAFKAVVNTIIRGINTVVAIPFDGINAALQAIKDVSIFGLKPFDWIQTIPVPQIPYLEKGGILEKGQVGLLEGNGAEAVVPLDQNKKWISAVASDLKSAVNTSSQSNASNNKNNLNQTINIYQPVKSPAETARAIKTMMKYGLAGA